MSPVLGRTRWIVSHSMLSDISQGSIRCMHSWWFRTVGVLTVIPRNLKHQWDDIPCPYDMLDGWEYMDHDTGSWAADTQLSVSCVHPHN